MSASPTSIVDLPWLPRAATEFRDALRCVTSTEGDWGPVLRQLASQFLNLNQVLAVTRALDALEERSPSPSLGRFRLGIASGGTVDFFLSFLRVSLLRHGLLLECVSADFGQLSQQALDPESLLNRSKLDAVLIAVDHRGLPMRDAGSGDWPAYGSHEAIRQLDAIREGFRRNSNALLLVQNLPMPPELLFGSLDSSTAGTLRASIASINAHLASTVATRGELLVDVEWLAQSVGLDTWYDERGWLLGRMPCSQRALPLYAEFVARTIAAIRGKARKCLVLDLDNTLWGGVIGDDGIDGIELSVGDARGEAFRAIQQAAADLRRRGILLAVCSKNDDATAREPFQRHPGMILRESDIAAFFANWDDKATNLERIAAQLELGVDSLVLLDDNPVERAQVRSALPQVAVPELGDDPSTYARILLNTGYFESVSFTDEDLVRADRYRQNSARGGAAKQSGNLEEFLRSLDMVIEFSPFSAAGRKRITQLINKTNQFNVCTRRYTEQQVAFMEQSPSHYTLQVRVRDRFGDNGVISAIVCEIFAEEWRIDTWLMSCRVLGRGIEQSVLNRIARDAACAGAARIVGEFVPTERNGIVRDLYERLGFARVSNTAESVGSSAGEQWTLDVHGFRPLPTYGVEGGGELPEATSAG